MLYVLEGKFIVFLVGVIVLDGININLFENREVVEKEEFDYEFYNDNNLLDLLGDCEG